MYEVMHPNPRLPRAVSACATALPQLAYDFTVMKLLIIWSNRAESTLQCLKELVLIQCGCLILFFFLLTLTVILQNYLLSLLQKHNRLTYGSLHCSARVLPHKACIFNSILRHQEYYWYLMTKTR